MGKNNYNTPIVVIQFFTDKQNILSVSSWVDVSIGEQGTPDIWGIGRK